MASGALEVVRYRPVVFVAKGVLNHRRKGRRDTSQLLMAEGIHRARIREEATVGVVSPFRYCDNAVADPIDGLFNLRQKSFFVEGPLREHDDVGGIVRGFLSQSRRSRDPSGMAPHHFKNEHLRGGLSHRRDVQPCLTGGHGHIFRYGTKARAAVGEG